MPFRRWRLQLLLLVTDRVCDSLQLTDEDEHLLLRARVAGAVLSCAEDGERDQQKLFDCARLGFAKGNGQ
jgi:hypothetical protein